MGLGLREIVSVGLGSCYVIAAAFMWVRSQKDSAWYEKED